MKDVKTSSKLLFGLPALLILINFIALIYGISAFKDNYNQIMIIVLFLWLPLLMIAINLSVIIYGIIVSELHRYSRISFILSLFFFLPAINLVTSVLSIVFGIIALRELKEDKKQKGRAIAIAGISIGIVTLVISLSGMIIVYLFPGLIQ